jgi:hypothetical protein
VGKLFRQFALAGFVALAAASPAHAADFLKAIEDMPLPQGMTEKADPVVFEGAQGRVVRTSITGNTPCKDVDAFYVSTLPALGWIRQADRKEGLSFKRDNEQLTLSTLCMVADTSYATQTSFELVVKLASTKLP